MAVVRSRNRDYNQFIMFNFDPDAYGPVCHQILAEMPLCELGPAMPNERQRERLAKMTPDSLFADQRITDRQMAICCLSGLWLLHNFLDESHSLSQEIPSTSGSYWHAIMHRREPDFANSKYWFRRVGQHPIEGELQTQAQLLLRELAAASAKTDDSTNFLATQSKWDSLRFVDLCEAVYGGRSNAETLCRRIAQREWQLLFDYCYRAAIGE
jgi:hypothetical protein